ncbi:MAG: hypothetical protein ACREOW_07155 [Thermodesulfobacteriota bacterium]
MSKKGKKFMSMLIGIGLISILLYSLVYILTVTTPSLAIPPKTATPTPTPPPTATPTPTPPPGTPTPTPTPTPPPTGRLEIQTIPQDDQLRKKGLIVFEHNDRHAEYKFDIRQNGVNVDPDFIDCIVLEKSVCNPKIRQPGLITEEELTEVFDVSDFCFCLIEQAPGVPGVGVIDLFCSVNPGDHVFKVVATRDSAVGSEIQDLCVLITPTCDPFRTCHEFPRKDEGFEFEFPFSGAFHSADPIFPFSSCKNAELFQRTVFEGDDLPQCTFQ